jgi:hypothetical protein
MCADSPPQYRPDMLDYPAEWRRALELLASSAKGCTASLLVTHGFTDATIAGLVDTGLATATTERILVGQRPVDMTWFVITDRGRLALER